MQVVPGVVIIDSCVVVVVVVGRVVGALDVVHVQLVVLLVVLGSCIQLGFVVSSGILLDGF